MCNCGGKGQQQNYNVTSYNPHNNVQYKKKGKCHRKKCCDHPKGKYFKKVFFTSSTILSGVNSNLNPLIISYR